MPEPIRAVSPDVKPRCPSCFCFIRLDAMSCSACGFALVAGTRRAETQRPFVEAQGAAFQNGPTVLSSGNALPQSFQFKDDDFKPILPHPQAHFSNLQPDGKIRKTHKTVKNLLQLSLFQEDSHDPCSFDFSEVPDAH